MEPVREFFSILFSNYVLYQLFSVLNFIGCAWAVIKMYNYFRPDMPVPKYFRTVLHGWIVCLIMFAVGQTNTVIAGNIGIAWTLKLAVLIFAWTSINFARLYRYINDSIET